MDTPIDPSLTYISFDEIARLNTKFKLVCKIHWMIQMHLKVSLNPLFGTDWNDGLRRGGKVYQDPSMELCSELY